MSTLIPISQDCTNILQQSRYVSFNDAIQQFWIDLIIGMNKDIASIDDCSPRNFLMGFTKIVPELIGSFADYLRIAANGVDSHWHFHPRIRVICVLNNSSAGLFNMDEVKLGVFHEPPLLRTKRKTELQRRAHSYSWNIGGQAAGPFALLKSEGLSQNAITNVWMKASGFYQIHGGIQQFPQVGSQCRQIEKRAAFFQVYQEIHIAIGALFAPGYRTEHTHIACAVAPGQLDNCVSFGKAESFQQHQFSISIVADFEKRSQLKAKAWGQNDGITVVTVRRNTK